MKVPGEVQLALMIGSGTAPAKDEDTDGISVGENALTDGGDRGVDHERAGERQHLPGGRDDQGASGDSVCR